jgi:molybdenum cofactor cytidylyltransferase
LAPWRHGRLIDAALAAAYASPARTVTVVWGAEPAVAQAARDWAIRQGTDALERLRLIQARDHALGLSASLRAGVASLAPDRAGVFIFLGDMPRIPHGLAGRLAERLTGGALAAAPMFEGRRGHPALIGAALFGRVAALTGDRGAGELLRGLGAALATVETDDDGVLFDVDRAADLS